MKTDIFLLHVLSSFFSFVYCIKSWNIENYLDWNTNVNVSLMLTREYWNRVVVVACKYFPGIIPIPNLEFLCQRGNKTHFSSLALVSGRLVEKLPKEISLETELIPSVSPNYVWPSCSVKASLHQRILRIQFFKPFLFKQCSLFYRIWKNLIYSIL